MLDTFRALAEPSRLRIVELLSGGPLPVGTVVDRLGIRQPQASKHLRVLSEAGLVEVRPIAQQRIYALRPEPLQELDQRFTLAPVPAKSSFRVVGQRLELKTPIVFAPQSAKPSREALFVLEELASFLRVSAWRAPIAGPRSRWARTACWRICPGATSRPAG